MRAVNYLPFPSSRAKKRKVQSDTYFVSARVKYCYVPNSVAQIERDRERRCGTNMAIKQSDVGCSIVASVHWRESDEASRGRSPVSEPFL